MQPWWQFPWSLFPYIFHYSKVRSLLMTLSLAVDLKTDFAHLKHIRNRVFFPLLLRSRKLLMISAINWKVSWVGSCRESSLHFIQLQSWLLFNRANLLNNYSSFFFFQQRPWQLLTCFSLQIVGDNREGESSKTIFKKKILFFVDFRMIDIVS